VELDLQRFYNVNRRILMWAAFFAILYLLRDFFAVMFLTFIFGFVMRKVARILTATTRLPYWGAVVVPYVGAVALLVLLITTAIPRVVKEGAEFSRSVPRLLETLADEVRLAAEQYGMEALLVKYIHSDRSSAQPPPAVPAQPRGEEPQPPEDAEPPPVADLLTTDAMVGKLQEIIVGFLPSTPGGQETLPDLLRRFILGLTQGTLKFLLAILLSFLIVLDYDRVASEIYSWRHSTVGRFFQEAATTLVEFSSVVGTAFQCQLVVAVLNTVITAIGLLILGIEPLFLLITIVFLFGLIPVLGVWISSVPIVLIAFNDAGLQHALLAVGMITIVHLLEAYVFNPRIYAVGFHLNPVIVLIILLVGHELFGVWGMLLGIPVTHYVLNIAQGGGTKASLREKPADEPAGV
jgi:predicted PurR-regulated permease PerM